MDLKDFLLLPSHRFRWGGAGPWADDATRGDDCMTFPASWVMAAVGIDPARKHRGTYRDRLGAGQLIDKFGGPLAFFAHHLEAIGAVRVTELRDGDVGLVHMLAGDDAHHISERLVGAIRFGPMWAAISPGGVVMRRARHERAWRLPNWG